MFINLGQAMQRLDIVIPVYNEEALMQTLYERVTAAVSTIADLDWRVILVNDGSADHTWALIEDLHQRDARFNGIDLSRNFGHQPAILAGLVYSNADVVVVMDGDLQDPPELIPSLVERWRQVKCEVVTAKRRSRAETGLRGLLLRGFHVFFGWISDFPIETNTGTFCLLDRVALHHLLSLAERNRFFPGLRSWVGFKHEMVFYDRADRLEGEPKQTFSRLLKYALDAVFSFSYKPLRIIFMLGALAFAIGMLIAVWFGVRRLLGNEPAEQGFTTLVVLILMFGGSQLIAIGILGEYLGRVYDEVKNRPHFLVRKTIGALAAKGSEHV